MSAQGPLVLGFWVWGLGVWGLGLTIDLSDLVMNPIHKQRLNVKLDKSVAFSMNIETSITLLTWWSALKTGNV